jgi:hypothetical protein
VASKVLLPVGRWSFSSSLWILQQKQPLYDSSASGRRWRQPQMPHCAVI